MTISHTSLKPFFRNINPQDVLELQTVHLPNIENLSAEDLERRAIEIPIRFPHLKEETPALKHFELRRRAALAQHHAATQHMHLSVTRGGHTGELVADQFDRAERGKY